MPTSVSLVEWLIIGLLVILIFGVIGIRNALARVESRINQSSANQGTGPSASKANAEATKDSAFEAFLAEDPQRLGMTKSEQFAAYRQWRKEKGMNWSNS